MNHNHVYIHFWKVAGQATEHAWEMQNNLCLGIESIFDHHLAVAEVGGETFKAIVEAVKKSLLAIGGENDCLAVGDCEQNKIVFP